MTISTDNARLALMAACAHLDAARMDLESLAANDCLSGPLRQELEAAAQHILETWCDDSRMFYASGLVAEVDEELKRLENPEAHP